MECRSDSDVEGRDASVLFTGSRPADWKDIAFLRGTSETQWLCAVTRDYKLVYSPKDRPWLFDRKNDPRELNNCFDNPRLRAVVRDLSRDLLEYCRRYHDPYGDHPKVKAEMTEAARDG